MEITEMCKVRNAENFRCMVEQLSSQGIRLALDDFGKGESNLLRLSQIPFQTLKLDKELVWGTEGSTDGRGSGRRDNPYCTPS